MKRSILGSNDISTRKKSDQLKLLIKTRENQEFYLIWRVLEKYRGRVEIYGNYGQKNQRNINLIKCMMKNE